ncbi:SusC/RagA family TonB-linked outer membrane protein [Flavobacterium saccharophilum]|uniref:TonB-linked outer membrane protein, SusC/RagA family n=1 Tax=Flavobacterium saccharophilum TaxID=29534 RepID=A0A1M7GA19_9FLAO|nr:TonB-dependent receptor [Flavobacterium saccharophilum]SHM12948.1 TonB-linked outer membrane protein, SusC/RagA family [Flavobacterium saccharophilum]
MLKSLPIPKKYFYGLLLLFFAAANAFAQNSNITGNVKDKTGEILPGVNIAVKGNAGGTSTDFDGNFSIAAPAGSTLVFSFLGFQSQEIKVSGSNSLKIIMSPDTKSLDEVVIVAYGTQKQKNVTGAVQTLSAATLKDQPVPQLTQKLQGKLAGVQITQNSGIPGQGMTMRIRGAASISSGSDPLYVVDGFPLQGNLANINPDEIETITVLKDASSTSLYGSRASNGVVLITTKKAKAGKSQFAVSIYTGVQSIPSNGLPDMMNAQQFAQFKKEIAIERGQPVAPEYANPQQYGEGTDWLKAVTRDAPITNYSITYSSSGEKFSTSIIGGYNKVEGVLLNSSYDRISVRMNSEYKFNDKVKIGVNAAPTYTHNKTPQSDGIWYNSPSIIQSALLTSPLAPYKNADGTIPTTVGWEYGTAASPNWYNQVQIIKNTSSNVGLLSNAFIEAKLVKGLTFKSNIGVDLGNSVSDFFSPSTAGSIFNPPNEADASRISGAHTNQFAYSWLWENTLLYEKSIGSHNFDALVGYTTQAAHSESASMTGSGFPDNRVETLNAAKTIKGSTDIQEWSLASLVARLNYNYKNKYLFSGAIRRDGSSRFGSDNKWGNFPSASVGWVATEESFIPKNNTLSFLKLRASYGVTGNNNIGNYLQYANVVATNNPFNNQLLSGSSIAGLNNNELGWETTEQFDAGIDINFFNDRIRFNYDYYKKTTDDLLYSVDIPISSGFFNYTTNIGKIEFWGHEFSVSTVNFTGPFRWTTDFNISFNRNKALALGTANAAIYGDMTITQVGQPLGQLYGLQWDGIYETQAEYDSSPKHEGASVGSVKYKDINGDGVVTNDSKDQTVLGNTAPKFNLGFTSTMNYKDFDFTVVCQGAYGNKIINTAERFTANLDGTFNVTTDVANRWKSEADPGDGKYGKASGNTGPERDWASSKWMYDGSYLTIKNITLGYSFNNAGADYLKGLRLYLSIQQAYVFSKYPGNNPEVSAGAGLFSGVDNTTYPVPRTLAMGLNYNF